VKNDLKDFFGSVGTGLISLISPPGLIIMVLIGIPFDVFLNWDPWEALLPGAVLAYSVGFLIYWEEFSHQADEGRRVKGSIEYLKREVASLEEKLKEAEEKASDDHEGRLVADDGSRKTPLSWRTPDGRLVVPGTAKPHPIRTTSRVRGDSFSDRIQGDGFDLYVDGFFKYKDEEDEEQEDNRRSG
jgi:hypothetical protein